MVGEFRNCSSFPEDQMQELAFKNSGINLAKLTPLWKNK